MIFFLLSRDSEGLSTIEAVLAVNQESNSANDYVSFRVEHIASETISHLERLASNSGSISLTGYTARPFADLDWYKELQLDCIQTELRRLAESRERDRRTLS